MLRSGIPTLGNYPASLRTRLNQTQSPLKCDSLSWDDLKDLRQRGDRPLIVKDMLRADVAVHAHAHAHECGADGIVVSNHGGRNLDASVPPLTVLPQIVDRVGRHLEVFLDGGFSRGSGVVKAVAPGAKGVFVGRAPLWGVAVDVEPAARLALQILRDEIDRVLAFCGTPSLQALDHSLLHFDDRSLTQPRLASTRPGLPCPPS